VHISNTNRFVTAAETDRQRARTSTALAQRRAGKDRNINTRVNAIPTICPCSGQGQYDPADNKNIIQSFYTQITSTLCFNEVYIMHPTHNHNANESVSTVTDYKRHWLKILSREQRPRSQS